ncbi:MAG: sulfatase-like hydrolase/transferase [Marinilabiliaceae bacterium]|nr:sulfatase-like hydrolase/transferase [Marinilabiliaceae bacterium]
MDRRQFIKNSTLTTAGAAVAGQSLLATTAKGEKGERPNIVLILTDQQTVNAMSCAGNTDLRTPSMDYLADRGTRFKKAYCTSPLCGPSRSSMLTGQLPHALKATINLPEKHGYWKPDVKIMGKIFKEGGYDTGYVGKWHLPVPVEETEFHGFDYITNTLRRDWQDASIPSDCNDFLKQKRENPFLMVASFINPHDICEWARNEALRMEPIGQTPAPEACPSIPDNYAIPNGEPSILRQQQKRSLKTYPTMDWDKDQWRQYRWAYNRLVEHVDRYVGYVINALAKNKMLDNTVIIFTSDHGDGNGSHRWNQKQVLYQEVVNVPFIVCDPRQELSGVNSQQIVNVGLDLIPTMCQYAGIKVPGELTGEGQMPYVQDAGKSADNKVTVIETEFANGIQSFGITGRAVLTGDWKYIVYSEGEKREQLFNLKTDPGEMNDLMLSGKYESTVKEMKKHLEKWCRKHQDAFGELIPG